jgi:hypothetical protein
VGGGWHNTINIQVRYIIFTIVRTVDIFVLHIKNQGTQR